MWDIFVFTQYSYDMWLLLLGSSIASLWISIVTGECAILILQKLCFKGLCGIVQFLLNIVINVTSFIWGPRCVFVVAIFTGECAILIPRKLHFGVCHHWYSLLIYNDSIILLCFILNWPMAQWWNGGWWNGVMVK